MTLAIGTYFFGEVGGMIVCADTNVVFGDDNVITGEKISAVELGNASFVIANAGNDADAGNMLSAEILEEISKRNADPKKDRFKFESTIKKVMKAWHSGYTQAEPPPTIEFILATTVGLQCPRLYYCKAPNTVTLKHDSFALGCGSRIVDPLLPEVLIGRCPLIPTILQISYLMHRAKRQDRNLKDSGTDMIVVSTRGECRRLGRHETQRAEAVWPDFDRLVSQCLSAVSFGADADHVNYMNSVFPLMYSNCVKKSSALRFASLNNFKT
jgi:hypothetical protein